MRILEILEFKTLNSSLNGIHGDLKIDTILECYSCKKSSADKELYYTLEKELCQLFPSNKNNNNGESEAKKESKGVPILSSSPNFSPSFSGPSSFDSSRGRQFMAGFGVGGFNLGKANSNTSHSNENTFNFTNSTSFSPNPTSPFLSSSPFSSNKQNTAFGDLSEKSNRKTFIHLIATLSSVFRDFNFSRVKCNQFKKVDSYNTAVLQVDTEFTSSVRDYSLMRNQMWSEINKLIDIPKCQIFSYIPDDTEDDPLGASCL